MKKILFLFAAACVLMACSSQDEVINPINEDVDVTTYANGDEYYGLSIPVYIYKRSDNRDYYYDTGTPSATKTVRGMTYNYYDCRYRVMPASAPVAAKANGLYLYYTPTGNIHRVMEWSPEQFWDNLYDDYIFLGILGYAVPYSFSWNNPLCCGLEERWDLPFKKETGELILLTSHFDTPAEDHLWGGFNSLGSVFLMRPKGCAF